MPSQDRAWDFDMFTPRKESFGAKDPINASRLVFK